MVDEERYDIEAKVAKNNKEVNVYDLILSLPLPGCVFSKMNLIYLYLLSFK